MGRSLRWTLIGWFAALLACVVAGFGAVLYGRVSQAVLAGVDSTIEVRSHAIVGALEWDERKGWELELSDEYLRGLAEGGWFEVRDATGELIRAGGDVPPLSGTFAPGWVEQSELRELRVLGARDARVRLGRRVSAERAALRTLLGMIVAAGSALLAIALLGGSWLATRTLRPIGRMSQAASTISARDLSQRIDPAGVPDELRELARTLNGAFDRLQAAFEQQTRFTADASHELRTPLTVIRTQCEQALRRAHTEEQYREALAASLRSAERMSGIVQGLLALARADAGKSELERLDLPFDALVREAADELREAARAADVTLALQLEPVRVQGDPALLAEVVSNLLSNAIRYQNRGGRVELQLRAAGEEAELDVRDDGPGIPADALPHVFERFYRVDPTRSREQGGAGLGLSITRWIVEAHGGSIRAESRLGEGSCFRVRLPRGAQELKAPAAPPRGAARAAGASPR